MSFSSYKKNRTVVNEKFNKKVEDLDKNPFQDDRFWELSVDKSGNGSAIIRFLPTVEDEDIPFVQIFEHRFKGPGGWYMEYCLTTPRIDGRTKGECVVCGDNRELWNSDIPDNKAIVSGTNGNPGRKRKLSYISNILVIKDSAHPENNGKVFLYRYGAKIFEKIQAARTPEIDDDQAINAFDMFEGANFNLIAKIKDDYRNYDSSKFSKPGPISKNEKEMESIYNQLRPLNEFIAENKFKSDSELENRFNKVLGNSKRLKSEDVGESESEPDPSPSREEKRNSTRKSKKTQKEDEENDRVPFELNQNADDEVSNDVLDKFRALAEE